jgi:hypothetical protein
MTEPRSTPPRPAPQYGEYATPEQQAAAMGKVYVPPAPPPAAGTRVDLAQLNTGVPGAAQEQLQVGAHLADRFATIFQLGIGLVSLLNSDWFHVAENLNSETALFVSGHRIATSVDAYGWVFLSIQIVFLLATMVIAYLRLRRAKTAFWVPFVGLVAFSAVLTVSVYIVSRR